MSTEFWVGLIVSLLVYGVSFGAFYGKVTTKLDALEKKQDKHNSLIERMVKCEESTKSAHHRIDDLKEEMKE